MELAKSFQWEDWTTLRFESRESTEYRKAVAGMAERLKDATALVEKVDPATAIAEEDEADNDDEPGFIDRVAAAETALEAWVVTLGDIKSEIEAIGELTASRGEELKEAEARGKGLAGRLVTYRKLAEELGEPAERVQALSNAFTSQMSEDDSGIKAIFEKADEEIAAGEATEKLFEQVDDFHGTLTELAQSAEEGLGALKSMIDPMASLERQSRILRPVLRKMRRGFSVLADGSSIISNWVSIADSFDSRHGR
jgi:hypothetical protein